MKLSLRHFRTPALALAALLCAASLATAADAPLALKKDDRIVIIGNTFAERQANFGHFETLLQSRFPDLHLIVHPLGWSADELTIRMRSKDFQDHGHRLEDEKPDVLFAFFGFNESFKGEAGLAKFEGDLEKFVVDSTTTKYNGKAAPKLVVLSPVANENCGRPGVPDGSANNKNIALYTEAMKKVVAKHEGVVFVDIYTPTKKLMDSSTKKLTFNGVHLTDYGYSQVDRVLDEALFGARPEAAKKVDLEKLRAEVNEKNLQFWYDYRAVNGFYIYGGRKNPFGVVNFPDEFVKLRKMIQNREERIWKVAAGQSVPEKIDDSNTGELKPIPTNVTGEITITSPEESAKKFTLADGYEVELFASEVQFPDLQKPVQMAFDAKGRMWVVTMPSYPMYYPGKPVDDKVLIFEDTNGDGKADKQTVFADKLYLPTGIEIGDGGAYVAQQPNLMFLKDTNGDDKADEREIVLHGFDTADSHHSISAFTWDPGGAVYFEEGTFHQSQIETPRGPVRLSDAGVYRYEPRSERLDVFVSYGFANPWGHIFDHWGQNFVADASGGNNYYGTAFSGAVDHPQKHKRLKDFLVKQWRPTSGCELVFSHQFADADQGNFLLNNCIGFQGVLQYKMREEGSGFAADPVTPLLQSSDPNFRPVDLELGPDGTLYIIDWYNPLVGHMQHSIRDPNRDHTHGRIWRVKYKGKEVVKSPTIVGVPTPELIKALATTYENRAKDRIRIELRGRDTTETIAAINKWLGSLDAKDPAYSHNLLEALWLHAQHDVVDEELLKKTLSAPDARARAAATRVLCYWRDRVADPLALLQQQVSDENPRVRLEAVRALSFFDSEKATEVAVESLAQPQDYYLEYTLGETLETLKHRTEAKGNK